MSLKCEGCGQFIGLKNTYAQGPKGYICHMKEKCLTKMFAKVKKMTPGLDFFEKNSVNTESMQQIVSAWGMLHSVADTMPMDEIGDEGIED